MGFMASLFPLMGSTGLALGSALDSVFAPPMQESGKSTPAPIVAAPTPIIEHEPDKDAVRRARSSGTSYAAFRTHVYRSAEEAELAEGSD